MLYVILQYRDNGRLEFFNATNFKLLPGNTLEFEVSTPNGATGLRGIPSELLMSWGVYRSRPNGWKSATPVWW